jgi:hypothetical protein
MQPTRPSALCAIIISRQFVILSEAQPQSKNPCPLIYIVTFDRCPIQARFWLEWGCFSTERLGLRRNFKRRAEAVLAAVANHTTEAALLVSFTPWLRRDFEHHAHAELTAAEGCAEQVPIVIDHAVLRQNAVLTVEVLNELVLPGVATARR